MTPEQMREAAAQAVIRIGLEIGGIGVPSVMMDAVLAIRAIPIAPQPVAVTVMDPIDRSDIDRLIAALGRPHGAFTDSTAIELIKSLAEALADTRIQPADPLSDPRVVALVEAAQALGAMPEGYCFCSKDRIGDDSKIHEPECRDLRAALRAIGGEA